MIRRIIALCLLILFVCTNHTTASLLAPLTTSAPTDADSTNTVIDGINNTIKHWNYSISDDTTNTSIRTYDGNLTADQRIAPTLLVEENASADTVSSSGDVVVSGNTNTSNPLTQLHVEAVSAQTIQSGYILTGTIGSRIIKDGSLTHSAIDKKQIQVPLSGTCATNYYLHTLPADGIIDNARHCKPLPTNNTVNICDTQPTHPCCQSGTRNCPIPPSTCGNNVVEPGETCDEGKTCADGTACTNEEQCGTPVTQEICTTQTQCRPRPVNIRNIWNDPICDDVQTCTTEIIYGELCKVRDTPTCDATCNSLQTHCGDGTVQQPNEIGTNGPNNDGNEECDDGNNDNNDACTNSCTLNTGCYNKDMAQHTAYPTVTKVWIPQQGRYTLPKIDRTSSTITIQGRTDLKNYFGPNTTTNPNYISGGLTALYGKAHINANGAHASYSCVTDTTGIDLEDDSYRFFVEGGDNLPTSAYASGQEYGQSTPVFDATYPGLLSGALSGTAVFADARATRQAWDTNYTLTQPSDAVQVACEVFNEGIGCRQKETTEFYYTYDWDTEGFSCAACGLPIRLRPAPGAYQVSVLGDRREVVRSKLTMDEPDFSKKGCKYETVSCRRSDGRDLYYIDKKGNLYANKSLTQTYTGTIYCPQSAPEKEIQLPCIECKSTLGYQAWNISVLFLGYYDYKWRSENTTNGCSVEPKGGGHSWSIMALINASLAGDRMRRFYLECPSNGKIMTDTIAGEVGFFQDLPDFRMRNTNPYTHNTTQWLIEHMPSCSEGSARDVLNVFMDPTLGGSSQFCMLGGLGAALTNYDDGIGIEDVAGTLAVIGSAIVASLVGIIGGLLPVGISKKTTDIRYGCDVTPEWTKRSKPIQGKRTDVGSEVKNTAQGTISHPYKGPSLNNTKYILGFSPYNMIGIGTGTSLLDVYFIPDPIHAGGEQYIGGTKYRANSAIVDSVVTNAVSGTISTSRVQSLLRERRGNSIGYPAIQTGSLTHNGLTGYIAKASFPIIQNKVKFNVSEQMFFYPYDTKYYIDTYIADGPGDSDHRNDFIDGIRYTDMGA